MTTHSHREFLLAGSVAGFLVFAMLAWLPANASDELYSKTFTLSNVTELEIADGLSVRIRQGEHEYIRAVGHPAMLSHIVASIDNNRLLLASDIEGTHLPVEFEIQINRPRRIALLGVANAQIEPLMAEQLELQFHGAGEFNLGEINADELAVSFSGRGMINSERVQAKTLRLRLSGSGAIAIDRLETDNLRLDISGSAGVLLNAEGRIDSSDVHLSGTGIFQAADTITRQAEIDIAGSASALVNVTESLDVNTAGSGTVTYYGNPNIDTGIFGTGMVRRAL